MKKEVVQKYRPYRPIELKDRTWPDRTIDKAPLWCSVDLRDGNQALIYPMSIRQKTEFFETLVKIGFRHIEVGFPAASEIEYRFLRKIIEEKLIPEQVTIQVLTQAREHLIRRTFEALAGVPKAIVHLYNSTSTLQRDVVFGMDKDGIINLAVQGTKLIKKLTKEYGLNITLEYSPESFTGTECDFAVEICTRVMEEWEPDPHNKIILNLPATVEMTTPNIYADQVEYFIRHIPHRELAIISLHTHNDRGTAVAATELGLMAGADRVEGTLFGNGERTGNVDIVTLALNMLTQGVDPELDLSDINHLVEVFERNTGMEVHPRHPYAGDLVFTAFSGSHQDAINKGMKAYRERQSKYWEVPYLPIDPQDIGRTYDSIIRINSQSGKGGVAYVMEHDFGFCLPKTMHPEFAAIIQKIAEEQGGEILPEEIYEAFKREYLDRKLPFELLHITTGRGDLEEQEIEVELEVLYAGEKLHLVGRGNGPLDSIRHALVSSGLINFNIKNYSEHSLSEGSDSKAIAYIQVERADGATFYGVGISPNIGRASVEALFSAVNRAFAHLPAKKLLYLS
ncbi:MAG: 2-isopropylmalate synthase [Leptospiraceae bacterium]|nr:2-isopropylmalate synthase [Leptospiraceae bacterium]MDW8306459.1 2-isopropylmalate synthase [Leptospiraceae bacterium]